MRYSKLLLGLFGLLTAVCLAAGENPDMLRIAAAANLAAVAPALQVDFNKLYPDAQVQFVFNASGTLTTQITKGAPFDVFLSADMVYPERLKEKGLVGLGPVKYISGQVVLLTTRKKIDLHQGLKVLTTDPSIKLIAIANPAVAPYGAAAVERLKKAGLWDVVQSKVVYAGNITQAFQYATTVTDVGFVAKSSLYGQEGKKQSDGKERYWIEIQAPLIEQGMIALTSVWSKKYVKEFYEYMLSERAQKIMEQYGYVR
jgi:molybdate transport system substrate-binding protein